jgi:hypothetical protein
MALTLKNARRSNISMTLAYQKFAGRLRTCTQNGVLAGTLSMLGSSRWVATQVESGTS